MTCHCVCKCVNLLTIEDPTDICRQCWQGSHRPPEAAFRATTEYGHVMNRVHEAFCGSVPGFTNKDLFGSHEEVADLIYRLLSR